VAPIVQALIETISDDNPGVELHVAGSWRRGADPLGDLDIVVISEVGFVPTLWDEGIKPPSLPRLTVQRAGRRLIAAEFELDDGPLHLDLFSFGEASRACALLAITGPQEANLAMRARAKRMGLALSQEALKIRATGEVIETPDEASIYARLGMRYETPAEREHWKQSVAVRRTST
jgi:DNA polymerase/3'-5' exonuclease PolX